VAELRAVRARGRLTDRELRAWTPQTVTDRKVLHRHRQISEIRARGWATAPGEVMPGVNTVAAPVFDHRGELAPTIAIVGAMQFITSPPAAEQIAALTSCARELSTELGWRPEDARTSHTGRTR
jgi:IclR family transcriptional regulator, acetate operon repressor